MTSKMAPKEKNEQSFFGLSLFSLRSSKRVSWGFGSSCHIGMRVFPHALKGWGRLAGCHTQSTSPARVLSSHLQKAPGAPTPGAIAPAPSQATHCSFLPAAGDSCLRPFHFIYQYIHIYMCVYTYIHIYMCACVYTYVSICVIITGGVARSGEEINALLFSTQV